MEMRRNRVRKEMGKGTGKGKRKDGKGGLRCVPGGLGRE